MRFEVYLGEEVVTKSDNKDMAIMMAKVAVPKDQHKLLVWMDTVNDRAGFAGPAPTALGC